MRFNGKQAVLAAGLIGGLSTAVLADANVEQIRQELAQLRQANTQLQQQVASMRSAENSSWLNERRAEEVKALVREVLADADTRASLAEGGITAGYNKGFFLTSEDGKFRLNLGGQIQFRYLASLRNDSGGDDVESGFQLRRTKLRATGHIGDPRIGFAVVTAYDRNTGAAALEEVKLTYKINDKLTFEAGRYKSPFMREELTSSSRQLAVERSYFNEVFTAGFTEGVGLVWNPTDSLRISGMLNDGFRQGETSAAKDFHNDDTDFGAAARVDYRLAGKWSQQADTSSWKGDDFAAFVGAAVYYAKSDTGHANGYNYEVGYTADVMIQNKGLGVFGAVSGYNVDGDDGAANLDAWGAMLQVSYMVIPDKFEPFIRGEYMKFNSEDETKLLTAGFNYYLNKHNAKFTLDAVWAMDAISSQAGLGLLGDAAGQDNQLAIRGQFQLQF